jgi:hypothetical protein
VKTAPLLIVLLSLGCSPAPEAPEDLSELTLYLFSGFFDEEAEVVAGLENLSDILHSDFDYDSTWEGRQVKQPPLTEDDLGGAAMTSAFNPDLQKRVAVVYRSRHAVSTHVAGTLLTDQEPLEPSATGHDRTFLSDAGCWGQADCGSLDTTNFITKTNSLYTIPYDATKAYRRYTLSDGRDVLTARVDQPEVGYSADGNNSLDQNFALEAMIEYEDDPTQMLRIMWVWTAVTINGDNLESINIDGIVSPGIDDTFIAHDAWYDEN